MYEGGEGTDLDDGKGDTYRSCSWLDENDGVSQSRNKTRTSRETHSGDNTPLARMGHEKQSDSSGDLRAETVLTRPRRLLIPLGCRGERSHRSTTRPVSADPCTAGGKVE